MSGDVHLHSGRDPHDLLGVPRGADRQQVIRAFHRRARNGGHPDTGGDARTFDEIVRARDVLLDRAAYEWRGRSTRTTAQPRATASPTAPPRVHPRPAAPPSTQTSRLAIATAVLALLGPLLWPVAIVIGHLALRQIKRTGQGGGSFVPVVLFFLYILTLPVLLRIGSVLFIP
jgi:curved DNA-binding protein CbpA